MMKELFIPILFLASLVVHAQPVIEWQITIGGSDTDELRTIQQTSDGGYILGGLSESNISGDKTENNRGSRDYWAVKLDATGVIQWQRTIGGDNIDHLVSIQQTYDGGYFLGGYSGSDSTGDKTENGQGSMDFWVVRLDEQGAILWQNNIGGSGYDELHQVQQTRDGGYVLVGDSQSNASGDKSENSQGDFDYWVVKIDALGTIQWENSFGGSNEDIPYTIQQTSDDGYIVGGWSWSNISGDKTESNRGDMDYWVVKLDSLGVIQWDKTVGGSGRDQLYSVQQTNDGGYILGGHSMSDSTGDKTENRYGFRDIWVVKLDDSGNILWQNDIGGTGSDYLYSIQQTIDGGYILGGTSTSDISGDKMDTSRGGSDYWVVKLNTGGTIEWQKTIGGNSSELMRSIQQTTDGGFILGGWSDSDISGDKTEDSRGFNDYWVLKLGPVLGIDNLHAQGNSQLRVYPNPFTNQATIEIDSKHPYQNLELKVYEIMGKLIKIYVLSQDQTSQTIQASEIGTGMFFVQLVEDGQTLSTGKIMILEN